MIQISPSISVFTYQETNQSGLQIMSLVFNHNCHNYHFQGRTTDTVYIFTEGLGIYVLIVNKAAGYISLNSFMIPESDPINSIYLHNNQEIREHLSNKWETLSPKAIVQKLITCLY